MTYPTAPNKMILMWENEVIYESSAPAIRLNGGVDFRSDGSQLNRMLATRQIEVHTEWSDYLVIDEFLSERNGNPFYLLGELYVCKSYSWAILSYFPAIPGVRPATGLMRLSASLEEVIRAV